MSAEEPMTVREVAVAAQRSEETIRRWIWSGKLAATKLGNQLFVKREDLEAMLSGRQGNAAVPRLGEAAVEYKTRTNMTDEFKDEIFGKAVIEDRGLFPVAKYEEARNITDDEAFSDEVFAKFGGVNIVDLLDQVRDG